MGKEKVTSQQVAELAGVSQSAVSRVYTSGPFASKKTTANVHKAPPTSVSYPHLSLRTSLPCQPPLTTQS